MAAPAVATENHYYKIPFITGLVILAVLALFLLHVLGSLRRMSSHKLLHGLVSGAYMLSYALASYTLGLMQFSEYYVDEFPVWALCLLLLLGSTDSLTACSLSDMENWKGAYVNHLLKGIAVMYIIVSVVYVNTDSGAGYLQAPLWAIFFAIVLQSYTRLTSMRMASKAHLLCQNVKLIADYMKHEHNLPVPGQKHDPVTMEGYRYVVGGERRQKEKENSNGARPGARTRTGYRKEDYEKITTVEEIWECKGSLLRPDDSKRGQRLKDLCLSMALSKMLNRRFAGFELAEAKLAFKKTHDFVFGVGGLLAGEKAPHERAFRIIEEELAFVHDLYYTRYPYLYRKSRIFALGLPVTMVTLCSWLTYELYVHFKLLQKTKATPNSNTYLHTTLVLMIGVTFLEGFQLYLHMASSWFKVALIRSYVTRRQENNPLGRPGPHLPVAGPSGTNDTSKTRSESWEEGPFYQKIVGLVLSLKGLRPWERKIGQYSLLDNFDGSRRTSTCLHRVTLCLLDKANKGYKGQKRVSLPDEVKQAVIASLVKSKGHLKNGVKSLEENNILEKFPWACKLDTDGTTATRTILVWHIATTFCKHQLSQDIDKQQLSKLSKDERTAVETASLVANRLSDYCAYLVAFEPNLLPDHSADSASILRETIAEARSSSLQGAKKMKGKCDELMSLVKDADAVANADASLVLLGGRLGKKLTEEEPALRWTVLSEFWAEMMLYVAPCEDAQARAHLEALARGGEFITHLWALLTHAGVLERGVMSGPLAAV